VARFLGASYRTVDEGQADFFLEWGQGFEERVVDADGFGDEAAHLLEDGAGLIGAVEGLGSECLFGYEAGIDELPHLALDGAEGDAGSAGKLAQIEGLPDVAVEYGEDGAARAAEEGFGEDGGCTHFGVKCSRKGYGGARGFGAARIHVPECKGPWAPTRETLSTVSIGVGMPRGVKCPVNIGDHEFPTKSAAKLAVREVLNGYRLGETLTGDRDVFVRDLIALHPATEDKIGCGIHHLEIGLDPDYGTTRCFHIVRTDGSSTDVSYIKCVDGENRRQLVRPALRNAILPQILHFKERQFSNGVQRCPYTNEFLKYETCHVDHLPPMTFETLVTEWLKLTGLSEADIQITGREDNNSARYMTKEEQIASWTAYHQSHGRLRLLSRRGNLSDSKLEAGRKVILGQPGGSDG